MSHTRSLSGIVLTFCAIATPLSSLGAQDSPLFQVVESSGALRYVKANRSGVSAWQALRELEKLGAFDLRFETPSLTKIVENSTMLLSFDRIEAVSVAELCAVAAGLDLSTERRVGKDGRPGKLVATIVRPPARTTENGRQRLIDWGLRWYRNLLEAELSEQRTSADLEAKIRIDSALLDMARGNWSSAAAGFRWLAETRPDHPWLADALLREAECQISAKNYEEAAQRASNVMKLFRAREAGARAALIYARATLAREAEDRVAGRFIAAQTALDSLVVQLELFLPSFRTREDYVDVLLALADAENRRRKPARVLATLAKIETVSSPILLSRDWWMSFNFLRGISLLATGEIAAGRDAVTRFLRTVPRDPRASLAWLHLAESELAREAALEALLAARRALSARENLRPDEASRALIAEAKASIALGDIRKASERLFEVIKAQGPTKVPQLVVDLGDKLIEAGRYEQAKRILMGLENERGTLADRARVLILVAETRQGQARVVVKLAKRYAATTEGIEYQARIAELAGDAYRSLGMIEDAARAYDGVVR